MLDGKTVLITGGTGSFGKKFTGMVLERYKPKKVIIFSRDEFKQYLMEKDFPCRRYPIRYFLGDIRDPERLHRAFDGVDFVVHAAALKQVPAAEYNPFEAVKTNILGAQNIVNAALDRGVKKIVGLSTDKAVSPVNLYGATKLAMEKLMLAANFYVGAHDTTFSVVRYGNVVGSRGSVIPIYLKMAAEGVKKIPVTDPRMTRFWITLEQGVELVLTALEESAGGEIFVPRIPSMSVVDLAKAVVPDGEIDVIGIRPGEKIHEALITEDEGRSTRVFEKNGWTNYVIQSNYIEMSKKEGKLARYPKAPDGFAYTSDGNDWHLTPDELREMIKNVQPE